MFNPSKQHPGKFRAMRLIVALLLLFVFQTGQSQTTSSLPNPHFEVDNIIGCSPFVINVENKLSGTAPILYYFNNTLDPRICAQNYQVDPLPCINGEATVPDANGNYTHTYINDSNRPQEFFIIQINGNAPDGEKVSLLQVTTLPSLPPQVDMRICGSNEVTLIFDFDADFYDYYEIDFGDGSGIRTLNKTATNETFYTYSSAGDFTINVTGMLSTGETTNCGGITPITFSTINETPEPDIVSIIATNQNSFQINYEQLNRLFRYELEVDFGDGFEVITELDLNDNPTSIDIVDGRFNNYEGFYSFRIRASDNCRSQSAISETVSSVAIDMALTDVDNTFNTSILWNTSPVGFSDLDFYEQSNYVRSFNAPASTGTVISYNDCRDLVPVYLEMNTNDFFSRSLTISPTITPPTVLPAIGTPQAEFTNLGVEITWPRSNFEAAEYHVLRQRSFNDYVNIGNPTTELFRDNDLPNGASQACYIITYTDYCGNSSEMSEEVCLPLVGSLKLPNSFTPNNDGVNDTFKPLDGLFEEFELYIYSRWGGLMFLTNDPLVGWDGNHNGSAAPPGTYMFRVSYKDEDGLPISKTGTFLLIR